MTESAVTQPRPRLTADETAAIVADYNAGRTIRAIAAALGRSYGCVHNVLTTAGVEFRPRGYRGRPSADAVTGGAR